MQALPNCSVVHQDDFFKVSVFAAGWAVRTAAALSFLVPGAPLSARRVHCGAGAPSKFYSAFLLCYGAAPGSCPDQTVFSYCCFSLKMK